jgi:hypothetical protein
VSGSAEVSCVAGDCAASGLALSLGEGAATLADADGELVGVGDAEPDEVAEVDAEGEADACDVVPAVLVDAVLVAPGCLAGFVVDFVVGFTVAVAVAFFVGFGVGVGFTPTGETPGGSSAPPFCQEKAMKPPSGTETPPAPEVA